MGLSNGNAVGIRGADVLAGRSGMKRGRQKTTRVSSRGGTALPAQARPRFHGARVTLHFYAPKKKRHHARWAQGRSCWQPGLLAGSLEKGEDRRGEAESPIPMALRMPAN